MKKKRDENDIRLEDVDYTRVERSREGANEMKVIDQEGANEMSANEIDAACRALFPL
jgi:hypothetical protein